MFKSEELNQSLEQGYIIKESEPVFNSITFRMSDPVERKDPFKEKDVKKRNRLRYLLNKEGYRYSIYGYTNNQDIITNPKYNSSVHLKKNK